MNLQARLAALPRALQLRRRRIFISYRRSDVPEFAQRLNENLAKQFGAANVFFDIADIEYGQRWRDEVTRQIRAADIVIALIGPRWAQMLHTREKGDDVLRFELATALSQKKQMIPVLVGETALPQASHLPQEIRGLTEYQALAIAPDDIDRAMVELFGEIKPGLSIALSWGFANLFGYLVGLLLVVLGTLALTQGGSPSPTQRFLAFALAGAAFGVCLGVPQWLVLRPWFERARLLIPVYIVICAVGIALAAGTAWAADPSGIALIVVSIAILPIALGALLWWTVRNQLIYAGWWSIFNLLAPLIGLMLAGATSTESNPIQARVSATTFPESMLPLLKFLAPMLLLSIASGLLLVWLMRMSEVRRR